MYEEKKGSYSKHLDFIILDFMMLQMTLILAYVIRFDVSLAYKDVRYLQIGVILGFFDIVTMYFLQSYKGVLKRGYIKELRATIMHVTMVVALTIIYSFLSGTGSSISRIMMIQIWGGGIGILFVSRIILKRWVQKNINHHKGTRHVVLVSTADTVGETMQAIKAVTYRDYRITKIILVGDSQGLEEYLGISIIPYGCDTLQQIKTSVVDEIFINLPAEVMIPQGLLEGCYEMGITVHMNLIQRHHEVGAKVVGDFAGYTVLTSGMKIATPGQILLKRMTDILGGLIGTLMTGLLTLILGPIIYLKDPGPIFFSQTRIGKNGRRFKIYKFRSMYMDAEARKKELMAQNEMQGLMFKMENDPRILPGIGNIIRDWSLDEFPQFINVLRGEMSLIGTRPPTVDEWEQYENHHRKRLAIKPGITGMWQVSGRSDIKDFEDVVALDAQYITEWTLGLDIKILLKTVLVVLGRDGSR